MCIRIIYLMQVKHTAVTYFMIRKPSDLIKVVKVKIVKGVSNIVIGDSARHPHFESHLLLINKDMEI